MRIILFIALCCALAAACPSSSTKLTPYVTSVTCINNLGRGRCGAWDMYVGVKNCDSSTYTLTGACIAANGIWNPTNLYFVGTGDVLGNTDNDSVFRLHSLVGSGNVTIQSGPGTASFAYTLTISGLTTPPQGAPNHCQN